MHTFAQKPKATQQTTSAKSTVPSRAHIGQSREVNSILHLQRTIGNQAVQRILQTDDEEPEAELTGTASPSFGHDFSRAPIHPPAAGTIQTKLAINKPGDEYEQEADRVAEQVMRMSEPRPQRACPCGGECPKCQTEQPGRDHERMQTKRIQGGDTRQTAPPIVHEVLRSPGQPLDPATRAFMEPRFGLDFSQVRVHSDAAADQSARDMNARAYTVGSDIVFRAGGFQPRTNVGRRLLSHELTHVMQQQQPGAGEPPGGAHEIEADSAALAVERGSHAVVTKASAPGVPQRSPNDELDKLLKLGPNLKPPPAAELNKAVARLKAGIATAADREVLLRQTITEARAYIQAEKGLPLSYQVLKNCCGPGRDVSAASFGALASDSPKPISIARFQAKEVFGIGKHGFTVVEFSDGATYLVDPTFGQFLRPGVKMDPLKQATAQVLRSEPAGAKMAEELVRNGFVRLTPENAELYARALGVAKADARKLAAPLFTGKSAVIVESVGKGSKTVFKLGAKGPDILDRSELIKFLKEEHIPNLKKAGDPNKLLPELEQLAERLQPASKATRFVTRLTKVGKFGGPFLEAFMMLLSYRDVDIDKSAIAKLMEEKLQPTVDKELSARSAEIAKLGADIEGFYGVYANVNCELHYKYVPDPKGQSLGKLQLYDARFLGLKISGENVSKAEWDKEAGKKANEGIQQATVSILVYVPEHPSMFPQQPEPTDPIYFSGRGQRSPLGPQPVTTDELLRWARRNYPRLFDDPRLTQNIMFSNEFVGSQQAREKAINNLRRRIQEEKMLR